MSRTVRDIYDKLNEFAPFETAEPWDHPGLQVGDERAAVTRAVVCLDVTEAAVEKAEEVGAQLIVSHHPTLFEPIHTLSADSIAYRLAASGKAALAAHTNLDCAAGGVNDCLCEVLELGGTSPIVHGFGRVGVLPSPMPAEAFAARVGKALHTHVRFHEGRSEIYRVAVVCGAGGEFLAEVREADLADAFVTGEIKHHDWLKAGEMTVIDAGHYATENVVVRPLAAWLSAQLPDVEFVAFDDRAPYRTV